jgi:hypothetical protein
LKEERYDFFSFVKHFEKYFLVHLEGTVYVNFPSIKEEGLFAYFLVKSGRDLTLIY